MGQALGVPVAEAAGRRPAARLASKRSATCSSSATHSRTTLDYAVAERPARRVGRASAAAKRSTPRRSSRKPSPPSDRFGFTTFKLKGGVLAGPDGVRVHRRAGRGAARRRPHDRPQRLLERRRRDRLARRRCKTMLLYAEDPCGAEGGLTGCEALAEFRAATGIRTATNMVAVDFPGLVEAIGLRAVDVPLADCHFWTMRGAVDVSKLCELWGLTWGSHSNNHFDVSLAMMTHVAAAAARRRDADRHALDLASRPAAHARAARNSRRPHRRARRRRAWASSSTWSKSPRPTGSTSDARRSSATTPSRCSSLRPVGSSIPSDRAWRLRTNRPNTSETRRRMTPLKQRLAARRARPRHVRLRGAQPQRRPPARAGGLRLLHPRQRARLLLARNGVRHDRRRARRRHRGDRAHLARSAASRFSSRSTPAPRGCSCRRSTRPRRPPRSCGTPSTRRRGSAAPRCAGRTAVRPRRRRRRTSHRPIATRSSPCRPRRRQAIDNVDAIAAVEGVDCVFAGPFDLSVDLGIPGQIDHPDEVAAIDRMIAACRTHGKAAGIAHVRRRAAAARGSTRACGSSPTAATSRCWPTRRRQRPSKELKQAVKRLT